MEDKHILQLLWERSEKAVTALASKFGKQLYRISLNILTVPEDAEEAVNDTYLALWKAIPPAKPDPLTSFVFRVGKNTALKHLRTRSAQKRDSSYDLCLEELSDILPGPSMEEALDARALGRQIDAFLGTIEPNNRRLFLRRYWCGDTIRELSREFGLSENIISVRLHRMRNKLKEYLNKEGFWNET